MSLADRHIFAEIQYETPDGNVHSDLCNCAILTGDPTEAWESLLHTALDEWLTKSGGTGIFYVGDPDVIQYDKED